MDEEKAPRRVAAAFLRLAFASRARASDCLRAMTERRYDDDEVAEIFRKAAEGPQALPHQLASDAGMTLAELQEIGREAGLSPEAVASAAKSITVRPQGGVKRYMAMPVRVERAIDLPRKLTDAEWDQLVVRLRETFNARGAVSASGSFRQWTNGNLQALLEPTPTGNRLRLSTVRASSIFSMNVGAGLVGFSALLATINGIAGHLATTWPGIAMIASMGAGAFALTGLQLPSWARRRARQMDELTSQLALETGADVADDKTAT